MNLIRGSQYIPLPVIILRKRDAVINIKNKDIYCFKWCVIASFFNKSRLNSIGMTNTLSYKIPNIESELIVVSGMELNFSNIVFPLKLKYIKNFEKNNVDISINVFGFEDGIIVGPYHLTEKVKKFHINLLLLTTADKSHFCLINDISR